MIADIFYPIFTLHHFSSCIRKKKLFRNLHTCIHQGVALDPLGGLKLPQDPQLQLFLALPRTDVPIFFLYYPLSDHVSSWNHGRQIFPFTQKNCSSFEIWWKFLKKTTKNSQIWDTEANFGQADCPMNNNLGIIWKII